MVRAVSTDVPAIPTHKFATGRSIDGSNPFRNWDWKSAAAASLIALDILAHEPTKRPRIRIMTEAGVIGKIGVNEFGVSTILNALKVSQHSVLSPFRCLPL